MIELSEPRSLRSMTAAIAWLKMVHSHTQDEIIGVDIACAQKALEHALSIIKIGEEMFKNGRGPEILKEISEKRLTRKDLCKEFGSSAKRMLAFMKAEGLVMSDADGFYGLTVKGKCLIPYKQSEFCEACECDPCDCGWGN